MSGLVHTDSSSLQDDHARMVAVLAGELRKSARMFTQGKVPVVATQEMLVTEALRILQLLGVTGLMHENLVLLEHSVNLQPQLHTACPDCPHKARLVKEFAHGGH